MSSPKIVLIGAISKDGAVGQKNGHKGLPWAHLSEDLKHFKAITTGYPIVMSSALFASFGGHLLPSRKHIIVSRHIQEFTVGEVLWLPCDAKAVMSHEEAQKAGKVFIIGGPRIWDLFYPYADEAIISYIDGEYPADTFYPKFSRCKMSYDQNKNWGKIDVKDLVNVSKDSHVLTKTKIQVVHYKSNPFPILKDGGYNPADRFKKGSNKNERFFKTRT
jgi:dihydrofolate reductase